MAQISEKAWKRYADLLAKIETRAADGLRDILERKGISAASDDGLACAYGFVTKYGEAAAEAACEMYDLTARLAGVHVPPAEPAATPTYQDVARTVRGAANRTEADVPAAAGRMVKQTAADTTLKNAARDGAEFAWIPGGDACAFCKMLASRGWQKQSKKGAAQHAEHIHNNCKCQYAVRFDSSGGVGGYDPEKLRAEYDALEGDTWQEKMNAMRRAEYAEHADEINAQKRAAYAARKEREGLTGSGGGGKITAGGISGALDPDSTKALEHAQRYYESVRHMTTDAQRIAENTGFPETDIQAIKDFVFNEVHDLGGSAPERFFPSYQMAESWQRLIDGKNIQPHDMTLLRHERMERELMASGMSQNEAHTITSRIYNYGEEARAFYGKSERNQKDK